MAGGEVGTADGEIHNQEENIMSQGKKIILTTEQEAYLRENFHDTMNCHLAVHLGISQTAVHRFARRFGLVKSEEGFRKIMAENGQKILAIKRRRGTNTPKGTAIPNAERYQFKKGESNYDRLGYERTREALEKARKKRMETFNTDRIRRKWGLPQLSRLRVKKEPVKKIQDRSYLKKRGYVIDEEKMIAYWTPQTQRATRLEKGTRRFYHFREYGQ